MLWLQIEPLRLVSHVNGNGVVPLFVVSPPVKLPIGLVQFWL